MGGTPGHEEVHQLLQRIRPLARFLTLCLGFPSEEAPPRSSSLWLVPKNYLVLSNWCFSSVSCLGSRGRRLHTAHSRAPRICISNKLPRDAVSPGPSEPHSSVSSANALSPPEASLQRPKSEEERKHQFFINVVKGTGKRRCLLVARVL